MRDRTPEEFVALVRLVGLFSVLEGVSLPAVLGHCGFYGDELAVRKDLNKAYPLPRGYRWYVGRVYERENSGHRAAFRARIERTEGLKSIGAVYVSMKGFIYEEVAL